MHQQVCRPPFTLQHNLVAHDNKVEYIGPGSVGGGWDVELLDSEAQICTDACSLTLHVRFAEFMHKCCSHTRCLDE